MLIVTVPVADVRSKPVDAKSAYIHDDLQKTQVLYNEVLCYLDEIDDWYYIEAIEQLKNISKNIRQGYRGWIRKNCVAMINVPAIYNAIVKNKTARILKSQSENTDILMTVSIGTKFTVNETTHKEYYAVMLANNRKGYISKDDVTGIEANLNESMLRKAIVNTGRLFIGIPYLWGGRSMFMAGLPGGRRETRNKKQEIENSIFRVRCSASNSVNTGVDCSGLTNLVYRANNIDIPRDAQEQWMAIKKIDCNRLKPGDLIFVSAAGRPDFINHVMLNIGAERFIEAAETGDPVMVNTFIKRFGEGFNQLAEHDFLIRNKQIHFGSVI